MVFSIRPSLSPACSNGKETYNKSDMASRRTFAETSTQKGHNDAQILKRQEIEAVYMQNGSRDKPLFEPCLTEQSPKACNLLPSAIGMCDSAKLRLQLTTTNDPQLKGCQKIRNVQRIYLLVNIYSPKYWSEPTCFRFDANPFALSFRFFVRELDCGLHSKKLPTFRSF